MIMDMIVIQFQFVGEDMVIYEVYLNFFFDKFIIDFFLLSFEIIFLEVVDGVGRIIFLKNIDVGMVNMMEFVGKEW